MGSPISFLWGAHLYEESLMQFHIQNMNCGGCARSVTKAIESVDPSAVVTTDVAARKVDVTSTAPREKLAIALTDIGYAPT